MQPTEPEISLSKSTFDIQYIFLTMLTIISLSIFASCDNTIDPLNEDRGSYSIYGSLNLSSEKNYIRVRDLNVPIRNNEKWDFNGYVTITNTITSDKQVLKDTLLNINDVYVWNFITTMPIDPGVKYRVTASNSDGDSVSAYATAPELTNPEMKQNFPDCLTWVSIDIDPVQDGYIEAEVGFEWLNKILWLPIVPTTGQIGQSPQVIRINFRPRNLIEDRLGEERKCYEMTDDKLYLRYTHFGPDFSDTVGSDIDKITGGAGKLGAYYSVFETFEIDTTNPCVYSC